MKRSLLIFAALAAWTACAQSARLGSLGRNDMVVTNIGEIARAASYGTDTRWTDATGCVWEVVSSDWVLNPATFDGQSIKLVFEYGGWAPYWLDGVQAGQTKGNLDSTNLTWTASEAAEALIATRRTAIPYTNYVGRLALTNGIPEAIGRKQDELPYPTNAIPYAAISGAPSGGPEWTISVQDGDFIQYVTNGMARVRWWDSTITDISDMSAWPDGSAMFVRFEKQQPITSWGVSPKIHLVGYGTFPTNNFQSVWWRSGTNIFVNILLEE